MTCGPKAAPAPEIPRTTRRAAAIGQRRRRGAGAGLGPRSMASIASTTARADAGREEEMKRLERLLLSPGGSRLCSIVGLAGTGGIGKSALAFHFATVHQADFPDGVIGLRVDGKSPDAIAREFARAAGDEIDVDDPREAATLMQQTFRDLRMLLIFDNADNSTTIQTLRPGGDRCAVLITTRDRAQDVGKVVKYLDEKKFKTLV